MEKTSIGIDAKEVVAKYQDKFRAFPLQTKVRIFLKTFATFVIIQVPSILYALKILSAPKMQNDEEVDLRPYAHRKGRGNASDEYYLTNEEIGFFNDNGYIPPFKVIARDEALALNPAIREKVMAGQIVYGAYPDMDHAERQSKMDKVGLRDDIESRSWNRHFNIPEIYGLLSKKEISHRLASLFGNDVVLWRSQLFPVPSGGKGTALHQVTDFRFAMNKIVLRASPDVPKALINLTVWLALNDVDETNGAMILVSGSYKNNRFEQYGLNSKYYVTQLGFREQWQLLFVRNVSNDASARFDLMNLYIKQVEKLVPNCVS